MNPISKTAFYCGVRMQDAERNKPVWPRSTNPQAVFLEHGYQLTEEVPIIEKSVLCEAPDILSSVLESIRPTLLKGYSIYVFEA